MWIQCITTCTACGSEVTLITDGRYGYGYVETTGLNALAAGDTDVVWRDGQSYVLQCPAYTVEGSCDEHVTFNGEGTSLPDQRDPYYVEPILESAP